MTTPGIVVRDLRIALMATGGDVVSDVSIDIRPGEVVGLVGESGSGKTSVGLAILGFSRPGADLAAGQVDLGPVDILQEPADRLRSIRGNTISYIPQDPATALNPALRIGVQIRELIEVHESGQSRAEVESRVGAAVIDVGLPGTPDFLRRYPHQLSGGQQQRICIAMAFLLNPQVVVLDEPTTGLDVVTQARVIDLIRRKCTDGEVSALYITHDLAVVSQVADRIIVLYAGRMAEEGRREDVLSEPRHPYTSSLLSAAPHLDSRRLLSAPRGSAPSPGHRPLGCEFHPRCEMAQEICRRERPGVTELPQAHRVRCHRVADTMGLPRQAATMPDFPLSPIVNPTLTVSGLSVAYGDRVVLEKVDLQVSGGECVALVGESGSGKSTLSRALVGLVKPSSGSILLKGRRLAASVRDRPREDRVSLQYVFQNPYGSLNPRKSIQQILTQPLRALKSLDNSSAQREAAHALERVGLQTSILSRYPKDLSGGERQRVALAKAIACGPEVLICDEVTSALDVSAQATIVDLLRGLVDELGLALIFVTHNLSLVRSIGNRCVVLNEGRIVESGPSYEVIDHPRDPYTRSLVAANPAIRA